jgi:hypothetical protein
MSVDMHVRRFIQELEKLPPFEIPDTRDQRVWNAKFPSWRAIFAAQCLFGHSSGYRLPSLESFYKGCEQAYRKEKRNTGKFGRYFSDEYLPGMQQRMAVWYESGMAETYLYVCLVEAIEDKMKAGVVLYDPRADWKLKADVIVLMNGKAFRINAFHGEEEQRPSVEARRDRVERVRKVHTSESAHWGNVELKELIETIPISKTPDDFLEINGVKLFSNAAIDALLMEIYKKSGLKKAPRYYIATGFNPM